MVAIKEKEKWLIGEAIKYSSYLSEAIINGKLLKNFR
jgi:hypothetical protein